MTIFRFSAGLALLLLLTGCAKNMPPARTELRTIAATNDLRKREAGLKNFVQRHLKDRQQLHRQLVEAGYEYSFFREEDGTLRDQFHWEGRDWGDVFSSMTYLQICGNSVSATAGRYTL